MIKGKKERKKERKKDTGCFLQERKNKLSTCIHKVIDVFLVSSMLTLKIF